MAVDREGHEANRRSWNAATVAHNSHKRDQAGFLRGGGSTLFPEEVALLGDVRGSRLVHLQCNAGQDTLSLAARHGARVVGVDISDEAVAFARALSEASGIPGEFVRADVYDWLGDVGPEFDVVFSSYGALGWLSDLPAWARGVARALRPGGRLVVLEFHPMLWALDEALCWSLPYFGGGSPIRWEEGVSDYVAASGEGLAPMGFQDGVADFANPHHTVEYPYTVADVAQAVIDAGLVLRVLREYPYANGWRGLPGLVELPGRRFARPADEAALPMMLGLVAERLSE